MNKMVLLRRAGVAALLPALLHGCAGDLPPAEGSTAAKPDLALAREVFGETNRLRADPRSYVRYLKEIAGRMKGKVYYPAGSEVGIVTSEGVAAVNEAIAVLERQEPVPPLTWSEALAALAREHVADTGPVGGTGHEGRSGRSFADRVSKLAERERFSFVAENLSYGYGNGRDVVAQLLIDDGVPERGHRRNILKAKINYSGVGCGYHLRYRQMCDAIYAYRD